MPPLCASCGSSAGTLVGALGASLVAAIRMIANYLQAPNQVAYNHAHHIIGGTYLAATNYQRLI